MGNREVATGTKGAQGLGVTMLWAHRFQDWAAVGGGGTLAWLVKQPTQEGRLRKCGHAGNTLLLQSKLSNTCNKGRYLLGP